MFCFIRMYHNEFYFSSYSCKKNQLQHLKLDLYEFIKPAVLHILFESLNDCGSLLSLFHSINHISGQKCDLYCEINNMDV